jgi:hypothetical protein
VPTILKGKNTMMLQLEIFQAEIIEAHKILIRRYLNLIKDSDISEKDRWIRFCEAALDLKNSDKLSRWVGFIQGILYAHNLISIEEERDFSRGLYKPIYTAWEIENETVTV